MVGQRPRRFEHSVERRVVLKHTRGARAQHLLKELWRVVHVLVHTIELDRDLLMLFNKGNGPWVHNKLCSVRGNRAIVLM